MSPPRLLPPLHRGARTATTGTLASLREGAGPFVGRGLWVMMPQLRSLLQGQGLAVPGGEVVPLPRRSRAIPMALVPSLLLASGETETGGRGLGKSSFKGCISPRSPLPPLLGGLVCWGRQSCPFPSLLHMCTCTTWLGKGKSPGISVCPLGRSGRGMAALPASTPAGNSPGSPLCFCFWCLEGFDLSDHLM